LTSVGFLTHIIFKTRGSPYCVFYGRDLSITSPVQRNA
jgi:hypothetical protein